jgi:hypothetical protein
VKFSNGDGKPFELNENIIKTIIGTFVRTITTPTTNRNSNNNNTRQQRQQQQQRLNNCSIESVRALVIITGVVVL